MSPQIGTADDEDDKDLEVQEESYNHDECLTSGDVSSQDPNTDQASTIDHVREGGGHPATPGILWQRPGRRQKYRLAAANKYGRKPSNAPDKGPAIPLESSYAKYNTEYYTKYNRNAPYDAQRARPFTTDKPYDIYDRYHLCMDRTISRAEDVPQLPLRLDDRLCALVYEKFDQKQLNRLWPSEFDLEGMVRATRAPLGHAAKHYYKPDDVDYDGNVLQPGEEGWYYLWLGGLQCLMGKEGWDAGRYLQRPSDEKKFTGFAFKKAFKAVVQAAPGEAG